MLDDLHVKCIPFGEENEFDVRELWKSSNEFLTFSNAFQLPGAARKVLCEVVADQNPELSNELIEDLHNPNTFTITTGHQLSFLGGPLYFYLKIAELINLAKSVNSKLNGEAKVIPVFWMATEDHDLAEIFEPIYKGQEIRFEDLPNNLQSGKWRWSGKEHQTFIDYAESVDLPHAWRNLLLEGDSQASFTRKIVRYFFPDEDLVILDANNANLKSLTQDLFTQDLNGITRDAFEESKKRSLNAGDKLQIQAQTINSFGLIGDQRHKIERFINGVISLDNGAQHKLEEIKPHFWSPNVVLRPLFQQSILPNIMYLGGGAEVKYWGQLKEVFAAYKKPFPLVKQRLSYGQISSEDFKTWEKSGLDSDFLLKKWEQVELHYLENESRDALVDLTTLITSLKEATSFGLSQILGTSNPAFQAGEQKRVEQFEVRIKRKIRKNTRETKAQEIVELKRIYDSLRYNGVLKERRCHPLDFNYTNIPWNKVFSAANSGFVLQLI